jgi:hypothetical protein
MLPKAINRRNDFSKLSVRNELRVLVNRIAADQNKRVYALTEDVFKQIYPDYFQNQEIKN